MPDFGRYSNYSTKTSFSSVVFGSKAPVLEVELNELQEIFNTKLERLSKFLGNTVISDSNGVVFNLDTQELTLTNCTVIAGSFTAFVPSASVTLTEGEPAAYLLLEERVVTGNDSLHEYGLLNSTTMVSNSVIDSRLGVETSRRKVIEVTLARSGSFPVNTDTCQIVPLGTMQRVEASGVVSYTFERVKSSGSINEMLDELRASLNSLIGSVAVQRMELTIPKDGWTEGGTDRYPLYLDVPIESVTELMVPSITVLAAGEETAISCGLCPRVDTLEGNIRVYAASVPKAGIPVSLTLQGGSTGFFPTTGGSGGGGGSLPIATASTPGAVKPGDGLSVSADGTLSVDRSTVLSDADLVNEEEVMESVVTILNEDDAK